jgi:hypothetical protein
VVELKWPVTVGWQVIATRYASNGRSLFFEFPDAMPEAVSVPLTIHLPEALDPSASRVLEIQLQQTDTADAQTLQLPVLENPQITRTNAVVIFPPAFSLNSDLQRRWSAGRRSLGIEDVRQQMPWFPESRLVPSMQFFEGGEALTRSATETLNQENADQSSIRLEHAIRISEGLIVEVSRFVVPADTSSDQQFSVLVPAAATSDLRWSLDGEPVAARREDNLPSDRDQRRWIISLEKRRPETACILRCESRRAVTPEFVAAVPMPESTRPLKGTLQLFSSEEGLLAVGNLGQETSRELADTDNQSTLWRLPEEPTAITVRMNLNPRIQSGQTIDIHMLHLIGEHNGGLHRDVLAVANVSRSAGENMLPLSLPANTRPLVLVDGFRVQLQETADGLAVPLPQSTADCQVVLTWRESGERPDRITGERRLPRLFQSELLVPQCTHHVLVEHGLELAAPDSAFLASEPTDITRILDRFLVRSLEDGHTTQSSETMTIPPDIRQFVIRWQLAAAQGWRPQTVIDPVVAEAPIVIRVTQLRRRLAIATGTCLMLIAACIGMRQFASQHRLAAASVALGLLGISFLVASQILVAALQGAFWGLAIGLLLILVSRWRWLSRIIRNPFLRASAALIASLLIGNDAWAAPQVVSGAGSSVPTFSSGVAEGPDVLIPDTPVADSDVVYVRRTLLDNWKANQTASQVASPAAVVTSLHSKIVSDSADSIELKLSLSVAAMSSDRATTLRIPLQGSRLVECLVNGVKVLPVPDGLDSIRVDIPASTVLPQRTLEETSELASSDQQANTAVDAGPLDAFTVHEVVCRLRPLTVRQASGVQFRLPGLPCPSATVEIVSPPNLYSSARAQTPEGVMQWSPADGLMPLKSLAMSSSIDVRLFQVGIEKGSPQHAAVRILTIHETVSGQQVLNCICRFSRWNTLTPEVRYRVPQGYELVGVSATTGADVVTDLLWSVKDQNATVLLPAGVTNEFVLQLQLVSQTPVTILNQPVPIVELQQFPDCVVSPPFLLAVRANAVFSVLPVEGDQVSTVSFADLKADWGHWLLGSDSVFRIPSGNPECVVRLAPRASVNEVRVAQDVSIHEGQIDWRCRIDVETSVLPVFRHRMQISSDILITDVQVVAGEANRLDSWHRRGDQLVVQLKEGTTGLHGISIVGRQILRPDDVTLNLHSAHLQNAQILDSSMTVVDEDGLGLTFLKLGGAVPVERVNPDDMLTRGTSVRMQIVDESQPVVLQRLRPVEPVGTIAAVRSPDDVTFILHITQWSGSLGPLHMDFPDSAEFIMEPVVVASGQPLPLVREAGEFVAGQDVVRSLFDQPEFTVVWTMPIREVNASGKTASFAWPAVFDGIQWSKLLLVPLDAVPGSAEETARTESPAPWLTRAIQASGNDPSTMKLSAVSIPLDSTLAENKLTIPVNAAPDQSSAEIGRDVIAFTDTVVVCQSGQSPVGETTVVLFSSKNTPKCSLTIPDGLVITELQSLESTRWEDSARERVMIELTRPVTIIRTRWLSTKAGQQGLSDQFRILPPFPADCQLRQVMTIVSPNGQMPTIRGNVELIPRSDLLPSQMADIDVGLNHARPSEQSARRDVSDPLPSRDSIVQTLTASRDEFLQSFNATERLSDASAFLHKTDSSAVQVSIDTEPDLVAVVSMITGIFMLLLTAFTENRTRPDPAVVSGGLSQQTKITGSAVSGKDSQSESQRSASGSVPPAGQRSSVQGSGRAPSSISQSNPKQT